MNKELTRSVYLNNNNNKTEEGRPVKFASPSPHHDYESATFHEKQEKNTNKSTTYAVTSKIRKTAENAPRFGLF